MADGEKNIETINERRARVAAMTYAEIDATRSRMRLEATIIDARLECPFCGIEMFRTLKPFPVPRLVWQCNGYLTIENKSRLVNDQPCGVIVGLDGEVVDFGFGKELLA